MLFFVLRSARCIYQSIFLFAFSLLSCVSLHALEFEARASFQEEYTNNVEQSPNSEKADFIHIPRLSANLKHTTTNVQALIEYDAERRIHNKNTDRDNSRLLGHSQLLLKTSDDTFQSTWYNDREETLDQSNIVTKSGAIQTLKLLPAPNNELSLSYQFENFNQDRLNIDNDEAYNRHQTNLDYTYFFNTHHNAQFSTSYADIAYRNADTSITNQYWSISTNSQLHRIKLTTQIGQSFIQSENDAINTRGYIGSILVDYSYSPITTLITRVVRQVSDEANTINLSLSDFAQPVVFRATLHEIVRKNTFTTGINWKLDNANQIQLQNSFIHIERAVGTEENNITSLLWDKQFSKAVRNTLAVHRFTSSLTSTDHINQWVFRNNLSFKLLYNLEFEFETRYRLEDRTSIDRFNVWSASANLTYIIQRKAT